MHGYKGCYGRTRRDRIIPIIKNQESMERSIDRSIDRSLETNSLAHDQGFGEHNGYARISKSP